MRSFSILSRGIHMHIAILKRVHNKRISRRKNSHISLRNVFFEVYFRDEGHFFANYLVHILLLCITCSLFQIRIRGIRMRVSM